MTVYELTGQITYAGLEKLPHKFPVGYKHSKAWRHHHIGKLTTDTSIASMKHTAYAVFVLDEQFGICPLVFIPPTGLHVKRRSGKAHISYQTGHDKTHIVVYALDMQVIQHTPAEVMDLLHKNLIGHAEGEVA